VSVIGRLTRRQDASFLRVRTTLVRVDVRCHDDPGPTRGLVSVTGIAFSAPTRLVVPCGGVRRVPLLDRVVAPAVVSSTHGARGVTPADEPRTERRPLAAGLLLAGATGLAVAAARVRVRGRRWGSEGGGLAQGRPGEAEPGSEPPRLTLVSVPREHGP
jgi:hypothetical protein